MAIKHDTVNNKVSSRLTQNESIIVCNHLKLVFSYVDVYMPFFRLHPNHFCFFFSVKQQNNSKRVKKQQIVKTCKIGYN